ncbi:DHA2 family efflux MFS transporter permease subunit [Amycolatopsis sp. OK19-0408]|uniref:DHA2 family efflux MFS transporter permease subunit n=1 Tax=Amycolatopsis iheyensis TaxID=2945988 RepID=A0A9X2NH46_9PSEU|nr:DHA2 family efflux MFS transporter permease subunit [Amycolatopsis iheyensis]MCR6487281.1 DHA2 family efflux MFS transporter permease subunit [Amycolatopsis iheyensis]
MTTTAPPRARARWLALGALGLAQLMVVLDTTVVNIALPSAQHALGMSDTGRQWTISAYTLAFGGLLLLGGRLADRVGRRTTLLIGVVGFALASAAGGAAPTSAWLIGARAAQGVFAALLAPSTMALLTLTFTDPRERAKAFGIFSAIMLSGSALGLTVGGALTEFLDWRWSLYVNIPIAVLAGLGAWFAVPAVAGHRDTRLDWTSAVLSCGGIVLLVHALSEVATQGFSLPVLVFLAVSAALLALFVRRQARRPHPLLPLSVVRNRARAVAYLTVAVASFGAFGMFLFLTYQLQAVMGYGALAAALAFLPTLAANMLTSTQVSGRLLPHVGPRPLLAGGLALLAGGLLLATRLTPDASYAAVILPMQLLLGVGAGLCMPVVLNVATRDVGARDAGAASAFVTTSQQVGASLGTATLNTIATAASAGLATPAAIVHGYTTAAAWAAGLVGLASLTALLVLPRGTR